MIVKDAFHSETGFLIGRSFPYDRPRLSTPPIPSPRPTPFALTVRLIPGTLLVPSMNTNTSSVEQEGFLEIEAVKRPGIPEAPMFHETGAIRRGNTIYEGATKHTPSTVNDWSTRLIYCAIASWAIETTKGEYGIYLRTWFHSLGTSDIHLAPH